MKLFLKIFNYFFLNKNQKIESLTTTTGQHHIFEKITVFY